MLKQITLNLDDYKEKDLPLTITINGNTYHSGYALATAQNSYFEMGKAVGIEMCMEEVKDNAYTDKEMTGMHIHWRDEGFVSGFYEGRAESIEHYEEEIQKASQEAYKEGYANGYKAAEEDIKVKLGVWE